MQKSVEAADESAPLHEEVNWQKKHIDEELTKNLSHLVGIRRKIIIPLKYILGLVCLVLFRIVYIVSWL